MWHQLDSSEVPEYHPLYRSVGVKWQCAILCSIHVKHVILSHSVASKNNSRTLDCRSHDLVQHSLQILFPIG